MSVPSARSEGGEVASGWWERWGIRPGARCWPAAAVGAWLGSGLVAVTPVSGGVVVVLLVGALVMIASTRSWPRWAATALILAAASGVWSQAGAAARTALTVPEGVSTVVGRVLTDPVNVRGRDTVVIRPAFVDGRRARLPDLAVEWPTGRHRVEAGEWLRARGVVRSGERRIRGRSVGGTMVARSLVTGDPTEPWLRAGNGLRAAVRARLPVDAGPETALLRGFLIGDTSGLTPYDLEALRRAGLTHFVAVSGSNVALFLGMWFLLLAPVVGSARLRAVAGLAALAVFVVATRWEPSVVRAAVMAGLVLIARAFGVSLDAWTVLGGAVAGLLILSPPLAASVGFQLSVAATTGVMIGARALDGRAPRLIAKTLGPTLGAQIAVAPLLLAHFGTVPLVAPLANLVAAPLVAAATTAGVIGVLIGDVPLAVGTWVAGRVIDVARLAAGWPQLDALGVAVMSAAVWALRFRLGRRLLVLLTVALLTLPGRSPDFRPGVVFLDVGQGDAVLVLGAEVTVLVDAGPDPRILARKLTRYGVDRLDLAVVSHPHADHAAGLTGLAGRIPIGRVWYASAPHTSETWDRLAAELASAGVRVVAPDLGRYRLGDVTIDVLGPRRRYASPNDQSLVVRVSIGDLSVLLPGDVEAVAQRELGRIPAQVLAVPHQGAGTSDPDWLAAQAPALAVISVGPNTYGHPVPWVSQVLSGVGARVVRTDQVGDVVVGPGSITPKIDATPSGSAGYTAIRAASTSNPVRAAASRR